MAKVALKTSDKTFIQAALNNNDNTIAYDQIVFWLNPTYIGSPNHPDNPTQLRPGDIGTIYAYTKKGITHHNVEVDYVGQGTCTQLFSDFTPQQLGTHATNAQDFAWQIFMTISNNDLYELDPIDPNKNKIPYIVLKYRDRNQPKVHSAKSPNARWSIDIIP